MSIADQITRIRGNISNAYDACNEKGATLPTTQNSANLAATITSIKAGGSSNFVGITREVNSRGVYGFPTESFTFSLPSGATDIGGYSLYYAFYKCPSLTSVDLSSLQTISGNSSMYETFSECNSLTSIDLSNLTTISGDQAMYQTFSHCTSLTSVDLSSLTTISVFGRMQGTFWKCTALTSVDLSNLTTLSFDNAMNYTFWECNSLTSVDLSNLTTLSGYYAMQGAFDGCKSLRELSFPALTSNSFGSYTNQFNGMLNRVTGCTVHFPSNLESVIGSWSDVTSGFGGTNTIVLFDLPATE